MGRLGCLLEAPWLPREARPPKAPQRHSKETVWVVWGFPLEVSGPPLGGLRAPKGTPKSIQGRGPGAPITSKLFFYVDGVHIFKNLCFLHVVVLFGKLS